MEIFTLILLLGIGLLLLLTEVFLLPGISIAGVLAAACMLVATGYAFVTLGNAAGFITLAVSALGSIGALYFFMRSKTLERLSLKERIDSNTGNKEALDIRVGDTGISLTRLALVGNADISGHLVEVRSTEGLINEKTPLVVDRITDGIIYVRRDLDKS
ncbi:MAG: NfeD family protein [Bacteroidaceae bacterium]